MNISQEAPCRWRQGDKERIRRLQLAIRSIGNLGMRLFEPGRVDEPVLFQAEDAPESAPTPGALPLKEFRREDTERVLITQVLIFLFSCEVSSDILQTTKQVLESDMSLREVVQAAYDALETLVVEFCDRDGRPFEDELAKFLLEQCDEIHTDFHSRLVQHCMY